MGMVRDVQTGVRSKKQFLDYAENRYTFPDIHKSEKSGKVAVTLDANIMSALKKVSEQSGCTMSQVVRFCVVHTLEEYQTF